MDPVIVRIRQELEAKVDPQIQETSRQFFREEIVCYGIRTAAVTALAKKYWKEIKTGEKQEIFALCEELTAQDTWRSLSSSQLGPCPFRAVWAGGYCGVPAPDRYLHHELGLVDGLCNHTMGDFIGQYPDCMEELRRWTQSGNRWMRRAAAVSLIVPAKRGSFFPRRLKLPTCS